MGGGPSFFQPPPPSPTSHPSPSSISHISHSISPPPSPNSHSHSHTPPPFPQPTTHVSLEIPSLPRLTDAIGMYCTLCQLLSQLARCGVVWVHGTRALYHTLHTICILLHILCVICVLIVPLGCVRGTWCYYCYYCYYCILHTVNKSLPHPSTHTSLHSVIIPPLLLTEPYY